MAIQLIISGMHRSGTSLVTSVLQEAGVSIGRDIAGPGRGNPRGHFEDRDFRRLHEDMLAAARKSWISAGDDFTPPTGNGFERRARTLIAEREALPLWGWKDPRTCLFLDFWHPILPEARYLFVYRHPVDVALSLWRRNTDIEMRQDPWLAFRAWEVHNRRLLEFRDRHPGRSFLAQMPALTADFGGLLRRLRDELGLPLQNGFEASIFAPEELAPLTPDSSAWEKLIPNALAVYRRLEESADLPARETTETDAQRPARERDMLQTSERLLQVLLERTRPGGPLSPDELRPVELERLKREVVWERQRVAELAKALRAERQVLAEIHGSRSFALVRAWWWLRRQLNGPRT